MCCFEVMSERTVENLGDELERSYDEANSFELVLWRARDGETIAKGQLVRRQSVDRNTTIN